MRSADQPETWHFNSDSIFVTQSCYSSSNNAVTLTNILTQAQYLNKHLRLETSRGRHENQTSKEIVVRGFPAPRKNCHEKAAIYTKKAGVEYHCAFWCSTPAA